MQEIGMDVDAVRGLADKLDHEASRLLAIGAAIDNCVAQLREIWVGHDSAQFSSWWHEQHRRPFLAASDAIAGLVQSARNNASDQEHASGGSGGAGSGSGGTQPNADWHVTAPAVATGVSSAELSAFLAHHPEKTQIGGTGECVEVFAAYNREVVGAGAVSLGKDAAGNWNGAHMYYDNFQNLGLGAHYEQLKAGSVPLPGDVIVWGGRPGHPDGHVAIVTATSGSHVTRIAEQNSGGNHEPFQQSDMRNESTVLGYLRPKN